MRHVARTVAKSGTESAAQPSSSSSARNPEQALQLEFRRRVGASRSEDSGKVSPANSIREALARWLEEEL